MNDFEFKTPSLIKIFISQKTGSIYATGVDWDHPLGALGLHIGLSQNPSKIRQALLDFNGEDMEGVDYSEISNVDLRMNKIVFEADPDSVGYETELTFEEFAPILETWEKAWAAAQIYKRSITAKG
jgi:hypothetical protein